MIRLIALIPLIVLAVACEDAERLRNGKPTPVETRAAATETTDATGTPVMSGADLYGLHCARCHGVAGDGKGTEKLETPARDFAAGGFSFGNTRTALFKTISRGIAGKEMPAFAEAMTEKERWRVIDHLLTLMPEQKEVDAKQRVLEPSDRPVIARGALYKKKGERAHITRGLMIGYPIGMSFEYRVDSPRLLRVREGGFVDRADWDGRGGALLEPLGKVLHEVSGGKAESTFRDAEGKPLAARYRGVTVEGDRAVVRYTLADGTEVKEWNDVLSSKAGGGYRRVFAISNSTSAKSIELDRTSAANWVNGAQLTTEAGGAAAGEASFMLRRGDGDRDVAFHLGDGGTMRTANQTLLVDVPSGSHTLSINVIPGRKLDGVRLRALAAELKKN